MNATTRPPKRNDAPRPKRPRRYVDAEPVRVHLRYLSQHGVGVRAAARLSGASQATIDHILYGSSGRAPSAKVTAETAAAILAVRPGLPVMGDGAYLDTTCSIRRLRALVAAGYTQTYLAKRLGLGRAGELPLDKPAEHITARKARAIRDLYAELAEKDPAAVGLASHAIARSQRRAAARDWARPIDWDDEAIDDPNAQAIRAEWTEGIPRAVTDAEIEDAMWVIRTTGADMGSRRDRADVAERLRITDKRLEYILAKVAKKADRELIGSAA